jgi:hypothetical protein
MDIEETEEKKPAFSQQELDQMAILKVKGKYTLAAIAKVLDEDVVRLRRWNPEFDQLIVNTATPIHLRIPLDKLEKFIISKEEIIQNGAKGQ